MKKIKHVYGICPITNKEQLISIYYLNASTCDSISYIKGIFDCNASSNDSRCNNCPIYKCSPETI